MSAPPLPCESLPGGAVQLQMIFHRYKWFFEPGIEVRMLLCMLDHVFLLGWDLDLDQAFKCTFSSLSVFKGKACIGIIQIPEMFLVKESA